MSGPREATPRSPQAVLAERFHGRSDTEANYFRAIYYLGDALWFVGAGDQALTVLNELFAQAMARTNGEHRGEPNADRDRAQ